MSKKQILVNQIQTPDGTILCSRHVHDYVTHEDKNGKVYMVDGGTDYLLRNAHDDYIEQSLYVGDDFELIRERFARGGRGKKGDQPLTYVPLKDMSDKWLLNTINYIFKNVYNRNMERIEEWVDMPENHFKTLRTIIPPLLRHHMRKNKIKSRFLSEVYIKEVEYRIKHNIYIPDTVEEEAEVAKMGLWRTLLNLVGL